MSLSCSVSETLPIFFAAVLPYPSVHLKFVDDPAVEQIGACLPPSSE